MSAYKINVVKEAYFFLVESRLGNFEFSILPNYLDKNCAI